MANEKELLAKLIFLSKKLSLLLLDQQDQVLPFAIRLDPSGKKPKTFYPADDSPDATWAQLLDAAADWLRQSVNSVSVAAVAVVTLLESDDQRTGVGVQIETKRSGLLLVYPAEKSADGWTLQDPEDIDTPLVDPVWPSQTSAANRTRLQRLFSRFRGH